MRFFLSNRWRNPRVIIVLFLLELAFTVPVLALFAVAEPDSYRTRLWQDGYNNGFNSSPLEVLWSYANHRTPLQPPLIWNQFITSYNVIISVLCTFLMIVKAVMFILRIWYPWLSAIVHAALVGLWAYSTYAQTSPDMTDPLHPQPGAPWYITKSCSVAYYESNVGFCRQAKAALAITVILMLLFTLNTAWALYSLIPTAAEKASRQAAADEEARVQGEGGPSTKTPSQESFELTEMYKVFEAANAGNNGHGGGGGGGGNRSALQAVFTPRTTAFRRLEGRDLPLRDG